MAKEPTVCSPPVTLNGGDDDFWSELNSAGREAMFGFSAMWPVGVWPRPERAGNLTKTR